VDGPVPVLDGCPDVVDNDDLVAEVKFKRKILLDMV
jgi:hypothetical protein